MGKDIRLLKLVSITVLFCAIMAGISAGMGASPGFPQIKIEGQQARLSPVMSGVGSIFMKIKNSGNCDDNLLDAKVSIPGAITELHDIKDGKMVKKQKILIPSKSVIELKPMSSHIMVFKMPRDIKEGHEFILYLMFEKSGEKQVPVRIVKTSERS